MGIDHDLYELVILEFHYDNLGEEERMRARFIVENTQFLCQISRILLHGAAPNRLFPVRLKTKLWKERFDSVRVRTFGY